MLLFLAQKSRMKSARQMSLSRVPPSISESSVVHSLFVKHQMPDSETGAQRTNVNQLEKVSMSETALENTSMTHPQERKYVAVYYHIAIPLLAYLV